MISLGKIEKIKDKLAKKLPGAESGLNTVFILTQLIAKKVEKGTLTTKDIDDLPLPITHKAALNKIIEKKDPKVTEKVILTHRNKALAGLDELKSLGKGNAIINWQIRRAKKRVGRFHHNNAARIDIYTGIMVVCISWIIRYIVDVVTRAMNHEPASTSSMVVNVVTLIIAMVGFMFALYVKRQQ
jgi:hypothetical protein